MASVSNDGGGLRRILFVAPDGRRVSIRLGKMTARQGDAACLFIEDLIACRKSGSAPKGATAEWLAEIPDAIRRRLERGGLVGPRARRECPTLGAWVAQYIEGRADVKGATATVYGHTRRNLSVFFGDGKLLDEITLGDADAFRVFLRTQEGLSENTARRRLAIARQFFRAAIRRKVIADNPFEGQATAIQRNPRRFYFVSREEAQAVLDACPSVPWRLVFALCRYAGLRCASEVAGLRWADVNWEKARFTVRATKTEHHDGAGERIVPIFPELRPFLLAAFEAAEPGAVFACPQYANANQMYKKAVVKYVRAAGLSLWPKLFQNLRSTRDTELRETFPSHVVNRWIGHTQEIAEQFYLQTTEAHFLRASLTPEEAAQKAAQNPAQNGAELDSRKTQSIENPKEFAETRMDKGAENSPLGRGGLEPPTPAFSVRCSTS